MARRPCGSASLPRQAAARRVSSAILLEKYTSVRSASLATFNRSSWLNLPVLFHSLPSLYWRSMVVSPRSPRHDGPLPGRRDVHQEQKAVVLSVPSRGFCGGRRTFFPQGTRRTPYDRATGDHGREERGISARLHGAPTGADARRGVSAAAKQIFE